MPTTDMTIPTAWGANGRIDAGASDAAVLVDVIDERNVFYRIEDSTSNPTAPVTAAHIVTISGGHRGVPRGRLALTLKAGESLFLVARGATAAAVYTKGAT